MISVFQKPTILMFLLKTSTVERPQFFANKAAESKKYVCKSCNRMSAKIGLVKLLQQESAAYATVSA